jgi:HK97 family phage portal protein
MNKLFSSILSKLKGQLSAPLQPTSGNPFTIWGDKKKISPSKAMDSFNDWVYACIRAIAEEIAAMKLQVFTLGEENEEIFEHDILDILSAPDENLTGYNLLYKTSAHLELTGNAYWFLHNVNDLMTQPTGITILNPGKIKAVIDNDTFPARLICYRYRENQKEYTFQPYEILHFEYPDPNDDFEGVGTVQSIARWIDADTYAMETNRRFFLNGARIGGFLESENAVTPQQLDYLTKAFESIYKGVDSSYKTAALPKGVKYTPASTTPKDMDFNNLGNEMMKRILAGFRVPKSVLGVTEDVNRANAEASNYIFALRTIKPKMDQMLSVLNSFFVPRFGKEIVLGYKDPVPENTQLKIDTIKVNSGNKQIKTVNEIRAEEYGLEPLDGGDELSSSAAAGTPPEPTKTVKSVVKGKVVEVVKKIANKAKPAISIYHRTLNRRKGLSDSFMEKFEKQLAENVEKVKAIKEAGIKELPNADWEPVWKDFAGRVGKFEEKMGAAMRDLHEKQCAIVISNLAEATKGQKAVNKKKLFDKATEVKATIDLVEPIITEVYKTEGAKAAELLGFPEMDITTQENVSKAISHRMELMADSYTQTTLDTLATNLELELVKGASLSEITDLVANTYEEWNGWRAEMVARTETFAAANSATKEAWKETGVVKTISWYTSGDDRVCDWCSQMDGKEIGIDDEFYKKGDEITAGDQTMSLEYDNIGNPPLHVNCNCYIKPTEISIED